MADTAWTGCHKVTTLLSFSTLKVLDNIGCHLEEISVFPPNVKDLFVNLMSKRGLFNDDNIIELLHKKIKNLDLSECEVSDVGLQHIARSCPLLQKIDLNSAKESRTDITSQGIILLAENCPHLQVVYLRRCLNIRDDAIIAVAQHCRHLRYLNIGGIREITDASLESLGQHSKFLRSINFSEANVSDNGVLALAQGTCGTEINEVHMRKCVALTDDAVEAVLTLCPKVTILLFDGCPNITERSRIALEECLGTDSKMKQVTWTIY